MNPPPNKPTGQTPQGGNVMGKLAQQPMQFPLPSMLPQP